MNRSWMDDAQPVAVGEGGEELFHDGRAGGFAQFTEMIEQSGLLVAEVEDEIERLVGVVDVVDLYDVGVGREELNDFRLVLEAIAVDWFVLEAMVLQAK